MPLISNQLVVKCSTCSNTFRLNDPNDDYGKISKGATRDQARKEGGWLCLGPRKSGYRGCRDYCPECQKHGRHLLRPRR